jgi:hypothetical protein
MEFDVISTWYTRHHNHTVERDPKGSLDRWPTLLRDSDIQGFWCYNTFVLPKWSMLEWPWHISNHRRRSQIIFRSTIRFTSQPRSWFRFSKGTNSTITGNLPPTVDHPSSYQFGRSPLGKYGCYEVSNILEIRTVEAPNLRRLSSHWV